MCLVGPTRALPSHKDLGVVVLWQALPQIGDQSMTSQVGEGHVDGERGQAYKEVIWRWRRATVRYTRVLHISCRHTRATEANEQHTTGRG